ncbi:YHS domain protein [Phycisphaerae bacterium RAS1]|nr:YHS domain protein [Phycisphaerae bacterium RAS1]
MMNSWMVMTGMAGMMAWLLPSCTATALAQCGTPCGPTQHAQVRQEQKAPAPAADAAQRTPGKTNVERQSLPPCPVTGDPIVLSIRTMTDGGPVYFSSEAARDRFNADPTKYTENAAAQRDALKKLPRVQVNCPVTGNQIDGKTEIFFEGKVVDFCCKNCVSKYDSDPEKYAARLEAGYTYQTNCPVSGDAINPTVYAEISDDLRVYFCCAGDRDAFMKGLRNRPAATTRPAREPISPQVDTGKRGEKGDEKKPSGHEGHGGSHP